MNDPIYYRIESIARDVLIRSGSVQIRGVRVRSEKELEVALKKLRDTTSGDCLETHSQSRDDLEVEE